MELKPEVFSWSGSRAAVLIVPFMELKLRFGEGVWKKGDSLNRTFYGIETVVALNEEFKKMVLIVPFMELKLTAYSKGDIAYSS